MTTSYCEQQPQLSNPYDGIARYRLFIDGRWTDAEGKRNFESINPTDGRAWAELADGTAADIDSAVRAARSAFDGGWRDTTASERAALLRRLGDKLAEPETIERLAIHEVLDTGKVIREAMGLARSFSSWCYYFAGLAEALHGETIPVPMADTFTFTVREPVGVVGAIIPWNSPILLTLWKLCPALACGNTVVIKPSEVAPASVMELTKVIDEAGVPPGVVNVVSGGREAGAALASHPGVDKLAFTGSTTTGRQVMHAAADNLTRVSLELGGKSPNIIFDDADLDAAVNGIVSGGFAAAGQMCTAGSRVLVMRKIYDQVLQALIERANAIVIGDPFDWQSDMGALTWGKQYEDVLGRIVGAQGEGARVVAGGGRPMRAPSETGFHIAPTVLADVDPAMRIAREEVFGPVVGLIPFDTEQEAVALANDTPFGLSAAVWTKDLARAHRMVGLIRAGTVWVNCYRRVLWSVPFGGVKASGFGRENGLETMHEYTSLKTAWIDTSCSSRDPFRLT